VLDEGHWLHGILSSKQKTLLTAALHKPEDWRRGMERSNWASHFAELVDSNQSVKVSWWKVNRPASCVAKANMPLEVSLKTLRENGDSGIVSTPYFYSGITWTTSIKLEVLGTAAEGRIYYTFLAEINHSNPKQPAAYTAEVKMLGVEDSFNRARNMDQRVAWGASHGMETIGTLCISKGAAGARVITPYIHPDRKLHFLGTITAVH
jgi:hypothetical protein